MSATPDVEQIEARERDLLERLPLEARHVPKSETDDYDAVLEAPLTTTPPLIVVNRLRLEPDTPLELKTCQRWISDRGSRGGRRRGQFKISERAHHALVDRDGAYCFVVLENDEILASRVVEAVELGDLSYTTASRYQRGRAALPWFRVIPKGVVEQPNDPDEEVGGG